MTVEETTFLCKPAEHLNLDPIDLRGFFGEFEMKQAAFSHIIAEKFDI